MSKTRKSMAIVIAGSGGTGAITAGSTLLATAARAGLHGLMTKLSGAQVRGGEAAALIEIGLEPIEAQPDRFDALIALDWENIGRFAPEIPLDADSIVFSDPKAGEVPPVIAATGASFALPEGTRRPLWMCSGNDAVGLGALRGGIEFVAAYPITPATEVTEWLAVEMQEHGGRVVLAEDEIAAINMCCGASFAGVPTMTITSGPGLALKVETIGLAIAAELPMLIVDVMRVGPSTGIPTKSDQGDLDIALRGTPGDAPRVVYAPMSIADCAATTERAVHVAEALQTPVMLLSDQSIGQTQTIIDIPSKRPTPLKRVVEPLADGVDFRRYALTDSGVSPMPAPGRPGTQWVADGLSHKESGHPSNSAADHVAQLNKRLRKLETFDWGDDWGEVYGPTDAPVALVAFGSTVGPAKEAARRLTAAGKPTKVVALRLLSPLQKTPFGAALSGSTRVVVIEQNASGQLFRHLLGERALPSLAESFARPGPAPFRPAEIVAHLAQPTAEAAE
jgi:2-oxoglutarate ferredoxin oxidoreductase subunit alpha